MNEDLAQLDPYARLLFAGLWTIADREGRLLDKPKRIKAQVLPYNDVDVSALLASLHDAKFIERYKAGDVEAIQIINFDVHQRVHPKEQASGIPSREKVRRCNSFSKPCREKNSKSERQATLVDPEDPECKKAKKIPKAKSGGERFKLPDSSGAERAPHPDFPALWLSGPELGKLQILFAERGLRKEFHPDAFQAVAAWFTEAENGQKNYPISSCHASRISKMGLEEALKAQARFDDTQAAQNRANGRPNARAAEHMRALTTVMNNPELD